MRNLVLKKLPTHLFAQCHEISCLFFWTASLKDLSNLMNFFRKLYKCLKMTKMWFNILNFTHFETDLVNFWKFYIKYSKQHNKASKLDNSCLTQFLPLLDTCEFLKTQNFPDQFFSNWYFWTLYNPLCPGKPLPLLFFDFTHFEKWQGVTTKISYNYLFSIVAISASSLDSDSESEGRKER